MSETGNRVTVARPSGRNGKIDLLRFVFSVVIALFHFGDSIGNKQLFPRGAVAVEFFFILSGFFMASSISKKSRLPSEKLGSETFGYVWKKYLSICPQILIAGAIGFVVRHLCKKVTIAIAGKHALATMLEFLNLRMFGYETWTSNGPTWYISAMLIAMLLLYPVCRRNFDLFQFVIAPIIGFGMITYLLTTNNGDILSVFGRVMSFIPRGLFRGIGEICLGVMLFPIVQRLSQLNLQTGAKWLITVTELLAYAFCFICLQRKTVLNGSDIFYILVLMIAMICSLSQQGYFSNLFNNRLSYWLGKFSLSVYLGHRCWSLFIASMLAKAAYHKQLLWFVGLSLVTALFIHFSSSFLRKHSKSIFGGIRKLLVK